MPIKSLIGIVFSLALIVALILSVNWTEVWSAMQQMRYWPLIPATLVFLTQYVLRSLRWRLLLPADRSYSLKSLYDSIMVGNLANFILPLRAGEFIRPFLLTRYCGVSFASSLVSVIVERFFDLSLVLILFGLLTFVTPQIPVEVSIGAGALSTLACVILVIIVLGSFMEEKLLSIFSFFIKPLPEKIKKPLLKFAKEFLDGAAVLKTPAKVFCVIVLTVTVWFFVIILNIIFFQLFDIPPHLDIALGVTVITALAVAAPSAPGFIGVYQWGCIASFALFGVSKEQAVAYSIITHIYTYLAFIIIGFYILWRDGLKLADLKPKSAA